MKKLLLFSAIVLLTACVSSPLNKSVTEPMSVEELNLPDDQAMALLKQRGPLDDVFKDFSKLETDYMETVRGAIESFAERKAAKDRNWEAR